MKNRRVSLREYQREWIKYPNKDCLMGCLWSWKKVISVLIMLLDICRRSQVKFFDNALFPLMSKTVVNIPSRTMSFPPIRNLRCWSIPPTPEKLTILEYWVSDFMCLCLDVSSFRYFYNFVKLGRKIQYLLSSMFLE
jgi:hypothetical protein